MSLLLLFSGGAPAPPPPPTLQFTKPALVGLFSTISLSGALPAISLAGQLDAAVQMQGVASMPVRFDFSMPLGDTEVIPLVEKNADGTAFDLTGCSITFGVSQFGAMVFQKTTTAGIAITNAAGGLATLTIDPANTSGLAPGSYQYDVLVTTGTGQKFTMTFGTLNLVQHPSR